VDSRTAVQVAGSSVAVSVWTIVSRVTGLGRVAVVAAVLGPTYLGNVYQSTNLLPNLTYELLTGTLFVSLLVPPLVRLVDGRDERAVERVAGGFLGIAMVGFLLLITVIVALGPWVMGLLAVGVGDPDVAAAERQVGSKLLILLMPQVLLYALAGAAGAVMNAYGRFALAAAAPALENIGIIATLTIAAVVFGTGTSLHDASLPQILLLGCGTTAGVALHAGALWWGARKLGVRVLPRAGWRDRDVREIISRTVPSLGFALVSVVRGLCVLVVANRIAGGVVAFEVARNFFYFPVAITARPVGVALLPALARLGHSRQLQEFRDELARGFHVILFLSVPAAAAYAVLARPLANAVSFREMAGAGGVALIAASLAALSPGVIGESAFGLWTQGAFALDDARSPFRAVLLRTAITVGGGLVGFLVEGAQVLLALGLAISLADLLSAWRLSQLTRRGLPPPGMRIGPTLWRITAASALMLGPAYLAAVAVPLWGEGRLFDVAGILAATFAGMVTYIAVQLALGSPEVRWLRHGILSALRGGAPS
jgi:putative peptidoglycan lipid II flippase